MFGVLQTNACKFWSVLNQQTVVVEIFRGGRLSTVEVTLKEKEKAELESVLKYSELSLIFLFEEFQIVNQDQELEAELKADVEKQMASLDKINM